MAIDPGLIPLVAARFKALGDPTRLALLSSLQAGEKSVSELVAATGRSQPNVSQHLASLVGAGLLTSRREANHVYYRITDPYVVRICDAVCDGLAARAREDGERLRRLSRVRGRRGPRG